MRKILFLLSFFIIGNAEALKFSPMEEIFTPTGKNATKTFTITNDTLEKIAIQITPTTRKIDQNGKEINENAEDDFTIYPSQIIMEPGKKDETTGEIIPEKTNIRVQWIGDTDIKEEKAFRIYAEQLPVNLEKKKGGAVVNLLLRYGAAVYIRPEDVELSPNLEIKSVKKTSNNKLKILFKNTGNKQISLKKPELTLTDGENSVVLKNEIVTHKNGKQTPKGPIVEMENAKLLAGGKRYFELPAPKSLDLSKDISASIKLQ